MNYKKEETESLLTKLNIKLSLEDRDKDGKNLLKGKDHLQRTLCNVELKSFVSFSRLQLWFASGSPLERPSFK